MKERILNTLKNYGKRAGTKLLSYLLEHLNKEFSFIQLDRMLHDENKLFKEDDNELMDCFADIINIPMCDQRTIDECKGRIKQIDRMIDQSVNGEKSHNIIELMSEKREIQKYLMEVTGRSGKIRFFKNEYNKIKDTIMKNIRRALKEIEKAGIY